MISKRLLAVFAAAYVIAVPLERKHHDSPDSNKSVPPTSDAPWAAIARVPKPLSPYRNGIIGLEAEATPELSPEDQRTPGRASGSALMALEAADTIGKRTDSEILRGRHTALSKSFDDEPMMMWYAALDDINPSMPPDPADTVTQTITAECGECPEPTTELPMRTVTVVETEYVETTATIYPPPIAMMSKAAHIPSTVTRLTTVTVTLDTSSTTVETVMISKSPGRPPPSATHLPQSIQLTPTWKASSTRSFGHVSITAESTTVIPNSSGDEPGTRTRTSNRRRARHSETLTEPISTFVVRVPNGEVYVY